MADTSPQLFSARGQTENEREGERKNNGKESTVIAGEIGVRKEGGWDRTVRVTGVANPLIDSFHNLAYSYVLVTHNLSWPGASSPEKTCSSISGIFPSSTSGV